MLAYFLFHFRDRLAGEARVTPCSPAGYPGRCYFVKEKICEIALSEAEASCKEFVLKLNLPPGRLTGPTMTTCQLATFDSAFHHSRRSDVECEAKVKELREWKRANMGGS